MNKITEAVEKELKGIARNLPLDMYAFRDRVTMTGAELKLSGFDEMPEHKGKFEDEKEYTISQPGYAQINHYRRLRHAYQGHGIEGVQNYVRPYLLKRQKELQNEKIKSHQH